MLTGKVRLTKGVHIGPTYTISNVKSPYRVLTWHGEVRPQGDSIRDLGE